MKGEIENNTITVCSFNTTLIAMNVVSREKINKTINGPVAFN